MDLRICPRCEKEYDRKEMYFSRDCHGIPYRLLCWKCNEEIEDTIGYDGAYYTEADECIDEYY